MPITSAWEALWAYIRQPRDRSDIGARPLRFQMQSKDCFATISTRVSRAKTCANFLPGTLTASYASCWRARLWTPFFAMFHRSLMAVESRCTLPEATVTNLFPMFMKLAGKQCLVVGAGKVGEPKIGGLIDTGALVQVVAIEASDTVR